MAFWVLFASAVKTTLAVRKIAGLLQALQSGDLVEALIRSYVAKEASDAVIKSGIPLDTLDQLDLTIQAEEWADRILRGADRELSTRGLTIDRASLLRDIVDLHSRARNGRAVLNGLGPQQNAARVADPVVLHRGEFERIGTDLQVNGAGMDLVFQRTYRSGAAFRGPLGYNWDHSLNVRLREDSPVGIVVSTGRLSEHRFVRHPRFGEHGFNYYMPFDGAHDVVVPNGAGSFTLKRPLGVSQQFEPSGQPAEHRIASIKDRFGNFLRFLYDPEDRLATVLVNSPARHITFFYDAQGRIQSLLDHAGRSVVYRYDDWGYLECVIGPFLPEDRAPRREIYEYVAVGTLRKLARVYDWLGRILVENEYLDGDLSDYFGYVVRQVQSRGESNFMYETIGHQPFHVFSDRHIPILRVLESRRNGHVVEHLFNAYGNELETCERVLDGGRFRQICSRREYNADGQVTSSMAPDRVLTQNLFGREQLAAVASLPETDPWLADVPRHQRMSFGNLLATVSRATRVPREAVAGGYLAWLTHLPNVKALDPSDVVTKFRYAPETQLLVERSDPRHTLSADPMHVESAQAGETTYNPGDPRFVDYQRHLTRFEYGPGPRFELRRTSFPDRSWPSVLDGVAGVTPIVEHIPSYDANGRILERRDTRGYSWFDEHYQQGDGPQEGFLKRRLVPHLDLRLGTSTPNLLEVEKHGDWPASDHGLLSSGNTGDHVRIQVEGVRVELYQSVNLETIRGANTTVGVRLDGVAASPWDQSAHPVYLLEALEAGQHEILLEDVVGSSVALGRVRTHAALDFAVDELGRVVSERNGNGYQTVFKLNTLGRSLRTEHVAADPVIINHTYDPMNRLVTEREEWRDNEGHLRPEKAVVRRFEYDPAGLLVSESEGPQSYGNTRVTTHRYDVDDNLVRSINSRGFHTAYDHDELNRLVRVIRAACTRHQSITRTRYDVADHELATISPTGGVSVNGYRGPDDALRSGIDFRGRVRIQTDPLGNLIATDYDSRDNATVVRLFQRRPSPAKGFDLHSRRATRYDEHGDPIRISEAVLDAPLPCANPVGAPDTEFEAAVAAGNVQEATAEFFLDAAGDLVAVRNPDGGIERVFRDGQGRPTVTEDPEGNLTWRIYDANGNERRRYSYDAVQDPATGAVDRYEAFTEDRVHDAHDRETERIDAYGNRWRTAYDSVGHVIGTDDPLGNIVRYSHNAFSEETQRTQERTQSGIGGGAAVSPFITQRRYDPVGNLRELVDPEGRRVEFEYDPLDRLATTRFVVGPDKPSERREYDEAGNLLWVRERSGLVKRQQFDLMNRHRRTEVDASQVIPGNEPSPLSPTFVAFDYDAGGHIVRHENDYCETLIDRDSRGLPLHETVQIQNVPGSPAPQEIFRTFDLAGNRIAIRFPSGRRSGYSRDLLGRVRVVRNDAAPPDYPGLPGFRARELARYSYSGQRLGHIAWGNGATISNSFDGRAHLLEQVARDSGNTILWRLQRLLDGAGHARVETAVTRARDRRRKYAFDSLYRLVHYEDSAAVWFDPKALAPTPIPVEPGLLPRQGTIDGLIGSLGIPAGQAVFDYDAMGNRTQTREPGAAPFGLVVNALNQYTMVGGNVWAYDANGYLRSDSTQRFTYDADGALQSIISAATGNLLASYWRDALGRVVAEQTDRGVVFRIHDGASLLVEIDAGSRREFTPGQGWDPIVHAAAGGIDYWLAYDIVGSLRLLTDSNSGVVALPVFRPFGAAEDQELTASPFPVGFAAMWHTTGLPYYHSQRRSYRSDVGRHFQPDPARLIDGLNLYTYVGNNPVEFSDGTGLGKGKVIGWVVKRTSGRLVKYAAVFTEKEAAKMFARGADVLLKGGKEVAKRVARKVIPKDQLLHHVGHVLKGGKIGRSHFQNRSIRGANSRHIFYGLLGGLLLGDEAFAAGLKDDSVDLSAIYTNEYPGPSKAHALTFSYWFGEDSWVSYLDWVNPGELVAMGGDLGRFIDRETSKDLIGVAVTVKRNGEPVTTYAVAVDGTLRSVSQWAEGKIVSTITGKEFLEKLEDPEQLNKVLSQIEQVVND